MQADRLIESALPCIFQEFIFASANDSPVYGSMETMILLRLRQFLNRRMIPAGAAFDVGSGNDI